MNKVLIICDQYINKLKSYFYNNDRDYMNEIILINNKIKELIVSISHKTMISENDILEYVEYLSMKDISNEISTLHIQLTIVNNLLNDNHSMNNMINYIEKKHYDEEQCKYVINQIEKQEAEYRTCLYKLKKDNINIRRSMSKKDVINIYRKYYK